MIGPLLIITVNENQVEDKQIAADMKVIGGLNLDKTSRSIKALLSSKFPLIHSIAVLRMSSFSVSRFITQVGSTTRRPFKNRNPTVK